MKITNEMKRIVLLLMICSQSLLVFAQKNTPKWLEKARKSVITVDTYDKDGKKLATGTAFYVTETGEALSAYDLFKGAEKAIVRDVEGKEYPVKAILGADELYDVIKFKVETPKKVNALVLAAEPVAEGAPVYLLPFSTEKTATFKQGSVAEISNLKDNYKYYKVSVPFTTGEDNTPLLTAEGAVFALTQPDAGGKTEHAYGLSAGYANKLAVASTDFLNAAYRNIGIRKGWPADLDQATVALYLIGNSESPKDHLLTINDFIETFPNASEGYLNRANHYAYNRSTLEGGNESANLSKALDDIKTALKLSDKPGDVLFNQAKLIYGVAVSDSLLKQPEWTIDAALTTLDKAISMEDSPVYHQLKGDIYLSQEKYPEAFSEYAVINGSDMATPATYYMAAKIKENITGFNIGDVIDLLTKAIEACDATQKTEASGYLLDRIEWRLRLMQYDEAVADYDRFYDLVNGQVSSNFYYKREQAKFRAENFDGALQDIQLAIAAAPENPDFLAEEASIYMRKQDYNAALGSLDKALTIAPDFAACFRLKGICFLRLNKKTEACKVLNKANELGDPVAAKLIKENCN